MNNDFLPQKGNYKSLFVYQLASCIYALTYAFAQRYLEKGDRTKDQMIQAARSGKQNIAEGSVDGSTPRQGPHTESTYSAAKIQQFFSLVKTF